MAEMKLYELVNHYHIGTELTCAEAVFMACNGKSFVFYYSTFEHILYILHHLQVQFHLGF